MVLKFAESEHRWLTNREIIFEDFHVYVITIPQRHGRTDRQRDGQTDDFAVAIPRSA